MAQLRDFYLRQTNDPAFRPDQLEVYDDLEGMLQQIRMVLFTQKGEVLGEPDFGLDVEKYLFEFSVDPFSLTREAAAQINTFVGETKKRPITVKPATFADDRANRDIFVLLISVPEIKGDLSIIYD